jgi:protein-S-isoprenylcysteine O-methyltransferase Ste14
MDPHERRSAVLRRAAAAVGGVLVVAAAVLGVAGVVVYTGGSDLGLLALVAALALVTAGAGLIVAAVRSGGERRR